MAIHIQLVNDQNLIREGLLSLIQSDLKMGIMHQVQCGFDYRKMKCSPKPDLIIMCLNSGATTSLDCVRKIASKFPEIHMLLIINKGQASLTNEFLHIGVKGIVSTAVPSKMLKQAILLVAEGNIFIEPYLAKVLAELPFSDINNPFDSLSFREHSILDKMLNGDDCIAIADKLHISKKTVANHHTHIMKKLAVKNMIELSRLAIRHEIIRA